MTLRDLYRSITRDTATHHRTITAQLERESRDRCRTVALYLRNLTDRDVGQRKNRPDLERQIHPAGRLEHGQTEAAVDVRRAAQAEPGRLDEQARIAGIESEGARLVVCDRDAATVAKPLHFRLPSGQYASGQLSSGSAFPSAAASVNVCSFRTVPRAHGTPQLTPLSSAGPAPPSQPTATPPPSGGSAKPPLTIEIPAAAGMERNVLRCIVLK